jgi:hypothetical protein
MKTGYQRIVRCALAALVLSVLSATAEAAEGCSTHPAAQIKFTYETPKPAIDNTKPQPELQRMAQKRDTQDHKGVIVGLYIAEMGLEGTTQFRVVTKGSTVCVSMAEVDVTFFLRQRTIYIVNTWKSGSCPYTAILGHERKHETTDERVFRDKTPIAKKRIADALSLAPYVAVPVSQTEDQERLLTKIVQDVVTKFSAEMEKSRADAQRAVDAGGEYQRITDSCVQFRRPA